MPGASLMVNQYWDRQLGFGSKDATGSVLPSSSPSFPSDQPMHYLGQNVSVGGFGTSIGQVSVYIGSETGAITDVFLELWDTCANVVTSSATVLWSEKMYVSGPPDFNSLNVVPPVVIPGGHIAIVVKKYGTMISERIIFGGNIPAFDTESPNIDGGVWGGNHGQAMVGIDSTGRMGTLALALSYPDPLGDAPNPPPPIPNVPTVVTPVYETHTVVTGTSDQGTEVKVSLQNGTLLGSTAALSGTSYSVTIPKQVVGTLLSVTANYPSGSSSAGRTATVQANPSPLPYPPLPYADNTLSIVFNTKDSSWWTWTGWTPEAFVRHRATAEGEEVYMASGRMAYQMSGDDDAGTAIVSEADFGPSGGESTFKNKLMRRAYFILSGDADTVAEAAVSPSLTDPPVYQNKVRLDMNTTAAEARHFTGKRCYLPFSSGTGESLRSYAPRMRLIAEGPIIIHDAAVEYSERES